MVGPENLDHLELSINTISEVKRKAMHVLFEDIENDVRDKEKFVISQNEKIKAMMEALNEQIEYKLVLEKADKIIHGKFRSRNPSLHSV